MQIKVESRHLNDVVVVVPEIFQDSRGFFSETFRADQFQALGLPTEWLIGSAATRLPDPPLYFSWPCDQWSLTKIPPSILK
jgi:hypothetical protein